MSTATTPSYNLGLAHTPLVKVNIAQAERLRKEVFEPAFKNEADTICPAALFTRAFALVGGPNHGNHVQTVRSAVSQFAIADAFAANIGAAVIRGFEAAPDSTTGWVRQVSLPHFKAAQLLTLNQQSRLEKLARGGNAPHVTFTADGTNWKLSRYAAQAVVSEEDLLDDAPVRVLLTLGEQLGAAARRVVGDLVYSLLLANPTLADGTALFATGHANLGTGGGSALDATSLGAGMAAIAAQVQRDVQERAIHVNGEGRFLVVPPQLAATARSIVRNVTLGDGHDLQVRVESRLGAAGVTDPDSGQTFAGTATNWLLCAKETATPSIVIGALDGRMEPRLTRFDLGQGEFGMGLAVNLDVAAAAVDHRGLYWSAGA